MRKEKSTMIPNRGAFLYAMAGLLTDGRRK